MKFKLGEKIRDRVSGLEGITTAYIVFLNGCIQWNIQPKAGEDGKHVQSYYYDEQQLERVGKGIAEDIARENKAAEGKRNRSSTGGAPTMVHSA